MKYPTSIVAAILLASSCGRSSGTITDGEPGSMNLTADGAMPDTGAHEHQGSPAVPCTDPSFMPPDFPPLDGTPFFGAGLLHSARGPNLETTGFRVAYKKDGGDGSAEIDMLTELHLEPQKLYGCDLLIDSNPNKQHTIVADGFIASACGNFIRRRKIVVATHLVDLSPGARTAADEACAKMALSAVGGRPDPK